MSTSSWLASAAKVPDGVPEKRHLRVGFVALSDAAPLVVAKRLELGHEHGLTLELSRESSWAAVRDKLITGELDAAHSLYGLVYGVQLGIGGLREDMAVLSAILAGGLSKIKEAGALLVGGHSVDDLEPKYGLAITGLIHPGRIISNSGARPGDRLYLSKPLGNGVITTALKAEMAEPQHIEEAVAWMTTLNKTAAEVMQQCGLKAATDITGFGFLGHLYEMAQASDVEVEVYAPTIPFMSGALAYAGLGLIPAGAYNNRAYLGKKIRYPSSIDPDRRELMLCP